jgi:hypothetical protein
MLTYAHVCSRMLTYAHVCSRMLWYGGMSVEEREELFGREQLSVEQVRARYPHIPDLSFMHPYAPHVCSRMLGACARGMRGCSAAAIACVSSRMLTYGDVW